MTQDQPVNWRALCEELVLGWDANGCDWKPQHQARWNATIERARAALAAEPVAAPAGPMDEELWQVGDEDFRANTWPTDAIRYARAVLARWGHQPAPSAVGEGVTDDEIERRFQVWWYDEGSGMPPGADEDSEAHVHRVSQIAWRNGAYVARYSHQPAPPAEGEVAELVAWLKTVGVEAFSGRRWQYQITRAADLLERRQTAPVPVAWCNSAEFLAASAKRQSFNGWLEQHSDCDMALCIAQLPAHALPLPAGEVTESSVAPVPEPALARINGILSDSGRVLLTDVREALELAREALQQRQAAPVPVAVSDRLPQPEACDAEGRCWWGRPESDDWSADWTLATPEAIAEFCEFSPRVTWLPFNALPLPIAEV